MEKNNTKNRPRTKNTPTTNHIPNYTLKKTGTCQHQNCNKKRKNLEIHHKTPISKGGTNNKENLIVLCPNCHAKADQQALT